VVAAAVVVVAVAVVVGVVVIVLVSDSRSIYLTDTTVAIRGVMEVDIDT